MMKRRHAASALAITAVAITLFVGGGAAAQQGTPDVNSGPPGWGPGRMMGPGMMGGSDFRFLCNPRSVGMAEWRIARIESGIKLTDAQKAALAGLRSASAKAAETISATCAEPVPAKSTERMALMEKRVEAGLQAIKLVRPAFEAFYGTLDDQQKARLDAIGPRRWGWRGWRWPWS